MQAPTGDSTDTELPDATHDQELSALPLPSFHNQVAGHKGISHEGGAILVPEPGKIAKPVGRGYFAGEDRFYRTLESCPALAEFCPAYLGTRQFGGRDYVVLEDLTYGMQRPLVVDIKVGTCTVAPDAPWMKRITHLAKDRATTTRSLGLRVVGAQTSQHGQGTDWQPVRLGKKWGKALRAEDMSAALRTVFSADGRLCTAALHSFLPRLHQLARVLEIEPKWHLVSSSLLFVFQADSQPEFQADGQPAGADAAATPPADAPPPPEAGPSPAMRMIDFAHAYPLQCATTHTDPATVPRVLRRTPTQRPCRSCSAARPSPTLIVSASLRGVRCARDSGYLYGLTNLMCARCPRPRCRSRVATLVAARCRSHVTVAACCLSWSLACVWLALPSFCLPLPHRADHSIGLLFVVCVQTLA